MTGTTAINGTLNRRVLIMAIVQIVINTDGDAFEDNAKQEVSKILQALSIAISTGDCDEYTQFTYNRTLPIEDGNSSFCGSLSICLHN